MEKDWKEKLEEFSKHARGNELIEGWLLETLLQLNFVTAKLPKWFGERPGKKSGEPDSPEEDEDAANEAAAEEDVADEEFEEE